MTKTRKPSAVADMADDIASVSFDQIVDEVNADRETLVIEPIDDPVLPEIMLANGRYYNFFDPDPLVVDIETIAHALSHICRFTGHVSRFYSVAEHCVRASYIPKDPDDQYDALMHDAPEALVADIATPLKRQLGPRYAGIEKIAEDFIGAYWGVNMGTPVVKHADRTMLATEKRDLMPFETRSWKMLELVEPLPGKIPSFFLAGLSWYWKRRFIRRYKELTR